MYFLLRTLFLLGSIHLLLVTSTPISSPDVLDTPPLPDRDNLVHWLDPQIAFQAGNGWSDLEVRNILDAASFNTHSNHSLVPRKTPTNKPHSKNAKQSKSSRPPAKASTTNTLDAAIQAVFNILKGVGDAIGVVITWYTGEDLKNPSCWAQSVWTPTDDSMICALTLKGWDTRPKCFDFLELCTKKGRCVFVRVVDTCAGCAAGSKHVDLTKGAFSRLGKLDTGLMNVKMRKSTQPKKWDTRIYGPKVKGR